MSSSHSGGYGASGAGGTSRRSRPFDDRRKVPIIRSTKELKDFLATVEGGCPDTPTLSTEEAPDAAKEAAAKKKNIATPSACVIEQEVTRLDPWYRPDCYIKSRVHRDYVSGLRLLSHGRATDDPTGLDGSHASAEKGGTPSPASHGHGHERYSFMGHRRMHHHGYRGPEVHFDMLIEDRDFLLALNKSIKEGAKVASQCDRDKEVSEDDFILLIDCLEKKTGRGPVVDFNDTLLEVRELKLQLENRVTKAIYDHWLKRRRENGKPLCRQFWPPTDPNDPSPNAVFRPRTKERMNLRRPRRSSNEMAEKLQQLDGGFQAAEKVIKCLKRREERKLLLVEIKSWIFDQTLHELSDSSYVCPRYVRYREQQQIKMQKPKTRNKPIKDKQPAGVAAASAREVSAAAENMPSDMANRTGSPSGGATSGGSMPITMRTRCRIGRGGRVWIDRYRVVPPPAPTAPPGPPPIAEFTPWAEHFFLNGSAMGAMQAYHRTARRRFADTATAVIADTEGEGLNQAEQDALTQGFKVFKRVAAVS